MASQIVKAAFETGDKIAQEQGVFLVDASFDTERGEKFLRLYIDSPSGVGLDECEAFSRAFEAEFDKIDPIDEAYCLEVSSPGADRTLKTEREFLHFRGRTVDVKLYSAADGVKEFSGVLEDFKDKSAYIKYGDKLIEVPVSKAAYIKLSFEM